MRLDAFFAAIAPYLEGRASHDEAVAALFGTGEGAGGSDAERLAIYGGFCRAHRLEAAAVFVETRACVVALLGEAGWESMVEAYIARHPMRSFELNENGAGLPAFLVEEHAARGLPRWIGELADLEWWTWRAEYGPDDGDHPDDGPLRISASVELRPYAHDLVGWLDADERAAAPAPVPGLVLFFRDRDLDGRAERARPEELAVLKMVSDGLDEGALARATGMSPSAIAATVRDLRAAGVLVGRGGQEAG
jgi:hypothetical protein